MNLRWGLMGLVVPLLFFSPTGEDFILTGGNVAFNITHSRSTDLSVELRSPNGTTLILSAPQTSLTDLSGENAHGYWTLRVWDYVPGTSGTLNAWSLTLNR